MPSCLSLDCGCILSYKETIFTMGDDKNADRSSMEIKNLLRKLDPDRGKHGDRVRALTKFRNYVIGGVG